jgi:hypothetical protein
MFTRGRPMSIVPIDAALAQRLSIVPEVVTPSSTASFLEVPRTSLNKQRPLSEVTEIYSEEDDGATQYDDEHDDEDDHSSEEYDDEINSENDNYSSEGSEIEEGYAGEMVYQVRAFGIGFI